MKDDFNSYFKILNDLLRNSKTSLKSINYLKKKKHLSILLNRIYYEKPKKEKLLYLLPITKCKIITSILIIKGVVSCEYIYLNDYYKEYDQDLLDMKIKDNKLQFKFEFFKINCDFKKINIKLKDTKNVSKTWKTIEFGHKDLLKYTFDEIQNTKKYFS